jgi:serine/threonine protein kinase
MYAFGVTLWEIFSSHVPYDTEKKPADELKDELRDLLTDPDDPLRPDLQLVDLRVRPLLQVCALALESLFAFADCSSLQPQRCWAMDPKDRISAADLFNELQKLPRNASLTAVAQVADAAVSPAAGPDSAQAHAPAPAPATAPSFAPAPAPAPDPKVLFPATALPRPNFNIVRGGAEIRLMTG